MEVNWDWHRRMSVGEWPRDNLGSCRWGIDQLQESSCWGQWGGWGAGTRLRKGQGAVELPVTVGGKQVRNMGVRKLTVGTGTYSLQMWWWQYNASAAGPREMGKGVASAEQLQIQAPPPLHCMTWSKIPQPSASWFLPEVRVKTGCSPHGSCED